MNVLIPMAGLGQRFADAGYKDPKPLISVLGKPMIELVIENLNLDAQYNFIVQRQHAVDYNLDEVLTKIVPGCRLIKIDGITEGAACSTLLAKEFINTSDPLIIANSDQYVQWNSLNFVNYVSKYDAGILTFRDTNPKWSFAKVNEQGFVSQVAEKNPISDLATVGIYYWKTGREYVYYAEQMIKKNIRINNEFYVCPVFNEAIADQKKVVTYPAEKMWGIGTPEDLEKFIKEKQTI